MCIRDRSWCRLLQYRCHLCTGLLPGTWNWSPPLTSGHSIPANICTDVVHAVDHDPTLFCADFYRCSVNESVGEILKFTISAAHKIDVVSKSKVAYGPSTTGDGLWWSWSSPGTSWTRRIGILDRHLLLSRRTPLADCSRGLHCWSSHIVPEWLEPVLPLCWSFWGPATGLHARLCQTPSWSLWLKHGWMSLFGWLTHGWV